MMDASEAENEGVINLSRVKDPHSVSHHQRSPRTSPHSAATNGDSSSPAQNMENGDVSNTSLLQQQVGEVFDNLCSV